MQDDDEGLLHAVIFKNEQIEVEIDDITLLVVMLDVMLLLVEVDDEDEPIHADEVRGLVD